MLEGETMGEAYAGDATVLEQLGELERLCQKARRASDAPMPDTPRVQLIIHGGDVTVLVRCRALYEGCGDGPPTTRREERAWRYDSVQEALGDLPKALQDELDEVRGRLQQM
jgi:hypothetical protein